MLKAKASKKQNDTGGRFQSGTDYVIKSFAIENLLRILMDKTLQIANGALYSKSNLDPDAAQVYQYPEAFDAMRTRRIVSAMAKWVG